MAPLVMYSTCASTPVDSRGIGEKIEEGAMGTISFGASYTSGRAEEGVKAVSWGDKRMSKGHRATPCGTRGSESSAGSAKGILE